MTTVDRTRDIVLVYDSSCAACSALALRVQRLFDADVTVRSCRDSNLVQELPVLRGPRGRDSCRRPVLVLRNADGFADVVAGRRLLGCVVRHVPVRRWHQVPGLAGGFLLAKAARRRRRRAEGS